MKKSLLTSLIFTLAIAGCSQDDEIEIINENKYVDSVVTLDLSRGGYACYDMETNMGDITLALDETFAPITSANFKALVDSGYYNNVIFHNVAEDVLIQAGNVTEDLDTKSTVSAIESEQDNGLLNYRGRIAMVRTVGNSEANQQYDTANSQFFININDNHAFDYGSLSDKGGYTVFGGVVSGMSVVDAISNVVVRSSSGFANLPYENVVINQVVGAACPAEAEQITDKTLPHPVVESDETAAIDLSRGDYACYQLTTSMGNIDIALDEKYAPATSANFKRYVEEDFYPGTLFHRVINDFVIQGGGLDTELNVKTTNTPIKNESRNGLLNYRSRLAMARTNAPHSATSQFFINTVDNHASLDHRYNEDNETEFWGYAVFGGVIDGMDVVDAIEEVETGTVSIWDDMPLTQVTIDAVTAMSCPTP